MQLVDLLFIEQLLDQVPTDRMMSIKGCKSLMSSRTLLGNGKWYMCMNYGWYIQEGELPTGENKS